MKTPGGALLIVLGMLALWLAITGRFDRLATAWDYVRGSTDTLPTGGTSSAVATTAHAAELVAALPTVVQLSGL